MAAFPQQIKDLLLAQSGGWVGAKRLLSLSPQGKHRRPACRNTKSKQPSQPKTISTSHCYPKPKQATLILLSNLHTLANHTSLLLSPSLGNSLLFKTSIQSKFVQTKRYNFNSKIQRENNKRLAKHQVLTINTHSLFHTCNCLKKHAHTHTTFHLHTSSSISIPTCSFPIEALTFVSLRPACA